MRYRMLATGLALCVAATVVTAAALARPSAPARSTDTELSLVAYSTPREAYAKLIPLFQKTAAGNDVEFTQSYGSSGEQTRAIKAGLKADIVALSLAPDVDELVSVGMVTRGGRSSPTWAWSRTRSSSSSCATATRRRSRARTTSFGRMSMS